MEELQKLQNACENVLREFNKMTTQYVNIVESVKLNIPKELSELVVR